MNNNFIQHNTFQTYLTEEDDCSYLQGNKSRSLIVVFPRIIENEKYSKLVQQGFRRSGEFIYRQQCDNCKECIPIRIPVAQFKANRSQLRCQKLNSALLAEEVELKFHQQHYDLFNQYLNFRHQNAGMNNKGIEYYKNFLLESQQDTHLWEFRLNNQLLMLSVIDYLNDGLSAVYTFFHPEFYYLGLGSYNIIWQINHAKMLNLNYIYLGYYVAQCRKMNYKINFKPYQLFTNGVWQ